MNKFQQQRRRVLLGTAGGFLVGACGSQAQEQHRQKSEFGEILRNGFVNADNTVFDPTSYSFENSGMCVVSAEAIEGPYYVEDSSLVRRDISEGKEGTPLEILIQVVDAKNGCVRLADAEVDIWHCDSQGLYSQYTGNDPSIWPSARGHATPTDNETFLRGRQVTDEAGIVQFNTIYPGWYSPRTQHIHARIFLEKRVVATIQMYFPDKLNKLTSLTSPYNKRTPSPYTNQNDLIIAASKGADGSWLHMTPTADGYRGTLTVGVIL